MMLPDLQKKFIDFLFEANSDVASLVYNDGKFSPEQRLNIYKNNTHSALTDGLLDTFSVVTKLVDENFMRYVAHEFIIAHPPQSGDLNGYGDLFSNFLRRFPPLAEHPYIGDVAALEWGLQETYLSQILPLPSAFSKDASLMLQPHVFLFSALYPFVALWKFAQEEGEPPSIEKGTYFALTCREQNDAVIWPLMTDEYELLCKIKTGKDIVSITLENEVFLARCYKASLFMSQPI